MNKFMNAEELNPDAVTHDPNEQNPIVVKDGSFSWGVDEKPVLKNISFEVEEGSLVAVVGMVGSGKSSLISAILGEMDKLSGKVNTKGSIAYVPQQAWIQNAILRQNIIFGGAEEESRYNQVIDSCALRPDFDILPAGDNTEIGEKGINLSGGQKQRVSLARAVYSDSDIYLMDDPLSAVDTHVGRHIFDNVIGPKGMLHKKTRILVTHGITFLPQTDKIIVLKDGVISEAGSYKELLDKKGDFAEFLLEHLNEEEEGEDIVTELAKIREELESSLGREEVKRQISRQRSHVSESRSHLSDTSVTSSPQNSAKEGSKEVEKRRGSLEKSKSPTKEVQANGTVKPKEGEKLIEAEKAETGKVKTEVYLHYLRSVGFALSFWTILLYAIYQLFSVGTNVWLSAWSNAYVNENDTATEPVPIPPSERDMFLGVYGALGFGQAIMIYFNILNVAKGGLEASRKLHHRMLDNILKSPMVFFETTPMGRFLNRFGKDVDLVDRSIPFSLRSLLSTLYGVLATIVVISYTTPIFLVMVLPIAVIYYFMQHFYVATSRQLKRLESITRSPIYSHFGETITGVSVIRAYSKEHRFIKESESKVDTNQICYYPSIVANRWLAVRLESVGNLIVLCASLFAVFGRESLNPGLVGLSISYALNITQTLNWFMRMTSEVETNIVAVERIKEYGETPQEAQWEIPDKKPPKEWPDEGKVEFIDYEVRYREGLEVVLKGINCSINGGEKVGIVGRTGAGKSSLTLGLFRIIEPAKGTIKIDGLDITRMGLHSLRSRLTIIPQDPVLFSGTLRMNLDPFKQHTDEDIWRALELAHLKTFALTLSAGLQHEVSEGGENLSVGQRQLVCLARALLRKTKVLILDEATAAVDLETDDLIQATIRKEFSDCTVITIAHRLNTIMDSTRVMVLDKGQIIEFDSPSVLLANKSSIFYGMAKDANLVQ
ncbi:multidrug resistance-associated protein 1-like isoform X3 [Artemia franciscana]